MRRTTLRLIVAIVAVVSLVPVLFGLLGLTVRATLDKKAPTDEPTGSLSLGCVAPRPESVAETNR